MPFISWPKSASYLFIFAIDIFNTEYECVIVLIVYIKMGIYMFSIKGSLKNLFARFSDCTVQYFDLKEIRPAG